MLNHSVPESILIQIGDITVSFSLLESIIQLIVGSLISNNQKIGQIVTSKLSFRFLLPIVISLYLEKFGEDDRFTVFKDLIGRAGRINEQRNQIIHSLWMVGDDSDYVSRIKGIAKVKSGLIFQNQEMSAGDIKTLVDEMKELSQELQDFLVQIYLEDIDYYFPDKK